MSTIFELVSGQLRLAFIFAVAPFFISFSINQNGVYRDYVAIGSAALSILFILIAFSQFDSDESKTKRLGIVIAILALAGFQLVRGFGLLA